MMQVDVHLEYINNELAEFTLKTQEGFFSFYFIEPEENRFFLFKRIKHIAAKDCVYILCVMFGSDVVKSRESRKEVMFYSYSNN